ncbi:MAG: NUDIX domain-containing protein [Actinomycetaceae bacterium]|nr:NUDIX domain-containing protein [Actinomycetaceae bacterium]
MALWSKEEWALGEDGVPTRHAARVIFISEDGHTLLMQGHDSLDPTYRWWFTVGGGIETGETPAQAAQREIFEETGYRANIQELVGPVIERDARFQFTDRDRRQIEYIYLVRTPRFAPDAKRWTQTEQNLVDRLEWVPIAKLSELDKETQIYPTELIELIPALHSNGWDGTCVKIDEYNENGA